MTNTNSKVIIPVFNISLTDISDCKPNDIERCNQFKFTLKTKPPMTSDIKLQVLTVSLLIN